MNRFETSILLLPIMVQTAKMRFREKQAKCWISLPIGRGKASPMGSEKERGRRPFQRGFGVQTGPPRPQVAGEAEGPEQRHRRQEKRRSALG